MFAEFYIRYTHQMNEKEAEPNQNECLQKSENLSKLFFIILLVKPSFVKMFSFS